MPPTLRSLPTITALALESSDETVAAVAPLPTRMGIPQPRRAASMSPSAVGCPVAGPVMISPSAPKNSAAEALSAIVTSAVIACELCFFLMSARIRTPSAPIARR